MLFAKTKIKIDFDDKSFFDGWTMALDRRRFLVSIGAGGVFGMSPFMALANGVLSLRAAPPGYRTPWTRLEIERSADPFAQDDRARRIIDSAYRVSGLRGDPASIDYALFDIGAPQVRTTGNRNEAKEKGGGQELTGSALPFSAAAAAPISCIATRELRAGGFIVRLLRRDEVSRVWSVGPAIAGDLDLRRTPAGLIDPVAPGVAVPAFVVADSVSGIAWTRHSPSGVWYPAGSLFIRPAQQGQTQGRAPTEAETAALRDLSWSNDTKRDLWRSEFAGALEGPEKLHPLIYDVPDDPLRPDGPSRALAALRSNLFAKDSFLWIDLATGARWVERGPLFVIRAGERLRMWRIGDDGSLTGVPELRP